jgi:hypothetical protein
MKLKNRNRNVGLLVGTRRLRDERKFRRRLFERLDFVPVWRHLGRASTWRTDSFKAPTLRCPSAPNGGSTAASARGANHPIGMM